MLETISIVISGVVVPSSVKRQANLIRDGRHVLPSDNRLYVCQRWHRRILIFEHRLRGLWQETSRRLSILVTLQTYGGTFLPACLFDRGKSRRFLDAQLFLSLISPPSSNSTSHHSITLCRHASYFSEKVNKGFTYDNNFLFFKRSFACSSVRLS
jgi:hypothetical protein